MPEECRADRLLQRGRRLFWESGLPLGRAPRFSWLATEGKPLTQGPERGPVTRGPWAGWGFRASVGTQPSKFWLAYRQDPTVCKDDVSAK